MEASELLAAPEPLALAASLLQLRADGRPARGQSPSVRVLGRCLQVGDCWEWQGTKVSMGYGQVRRGGDKVPAHRVIYTELNGPLPTEVFVCHSCDNPPCCNPAHLFAGTAGDNNRDRQAKGRTRGLQPGVGSKANRSKTHCIHGHEFTPENTMRPPSGGRGCITCQRNRDMKRGPR